MKEIPLDKLKAYQSQQKATHSLLVQGGSKRRVGRNEELTNIAAKRGADTLKFTYLMLKTRLARDLDETIASHLAEHPEMKDQFFIGVITGGQFTAEVVKLSDASNAVEGLAPEEAHQQLSRDPIGYFSADDFTLKTPAEPGYRSLKAKLDSFFNRSQEIMNYLRANPDADVSTSDLYHAPG